MSSSASALQLAFSYSEISCSSCGITFWVPQNWERARRGDHQSFLCPNGHSQHFPWESEAERLKKELAKAQERVRWAEESAKRAAASRAAIVGQMTKLRKRIAAGVCPCCNRSFKNLSRHMKTKHPEELQKGREAAV